MGDRTGIEWTDATWNPIVGCSLVSPGCTNCYAMRQTARLLDKPGSHYAGTTRVVNGNPVWTGKVALAPAHILTGPLCWRKPSRVFVNSMGDLFHESVPDDWIDRVFAVMALAPEHTFQVLTKRSARMWEYISTRAELDEGRHADEPARIAMTALASTRGLREMERALESIPLGKFGGKFGAHVPWPLPNVWLGVSCEDQTRADERIPDLLATPAAVRFVSAEPLLGAIDLTKIDLRDDCFVNALAGDYYLPIVQSDGSVINTVVETGSGARIDWVIVGGESGPGARPMHPDWARSIRDQCANAGVPFFFKQWGGVSKARAGRLLDGRTHDAMPDAPR
jgi:protein gp37